MSGLLSLMQADNAAARHPFRADGPLWPKLSSELAGLSLAAANRHFASYPPGDRHYRGFCEHLGSKRSCNDWYVAACEAYRGKLLEQDKHGILARSSPAPGFEWDHLLSVEEVQSMVELVGECSSMHSLLSDPLVVLDFGCGWGRIGHMLVQLNPLLTYVACDLPEALFIAHEELSRWARQAAPTVTVHSYEETRVMTTFDRRSLAPGVWFCGTQHLDSFADGSIDLFVNAFSFQEMTTAQVDAYFGIIDRVTKGGCFYNQQRKAGDELTQGGYPYRPTWERVFERDALFMSGYFEAGLRVR